MRKVKGHGVNDLPKSSARYVNGVRERCPIYCAWDRMLSRCYDEKVHKSHPTYKDCSVCDEWLVFSKFKAWMETQDWEGKHLDKDILVKGNKIYSPETCVFVTRDVNAFMVDRQDFSRALPQGVRERYKGRFIASCKAFKSKSVDIGIFNTPEAASSAYIQYKQHLALQLAKIQTDDRVAEAIIKMWFKHNGGAHWTEVVEGALDRLYYKGDK